MKIVSLLPSATEIAFALGLGDSVVAVTHECDYPSAALAKPHITRSIIPPGLSSREIDAIVTNKIGDSHSLYTIDSELLQALQPDLILTQQLCDVCAVAYDDVVAAVCFLPEPRPQVLNLEPTTLSDILENIRQVGAAAGIPEKAEQVIAGLQARIDDVRTTVAHFTETRPRTVLLEWIDPLFCGGHWDPELVEIAGGHDALGRMHEPSTQITWDSIREFDPEVLVIAQCGFPIERSIEDIPILEALPGYTDLAAVRNGNVYLVNGSDYFSRPGPRVVDSLELMARMIHPAIFGEPDDPRKILRINALLGK
ncbi:cobalamin-binding protein [Capsulimonas corticalis]|uniref:Cobalamin-binding protein n=1 Tax=Capsulimonas corticalis TaxID=2219043 RepID=A0A402D144_9BACT|nr:cobalamin-binding protein [Capsulimonas corticalis]BDI31707.1 cobalamin-binding protein [Capsulimonas corticalis]